MTSVKMSLHIQKSVLLFWKLLSYLVCVQSFTYTSSLSREKHGRGNFTSTPGQWLRAQNMLVGIGLIKLTEPTYKLNKKLHELNVLE